MSPPQSPAPTKGVSRNANLETLDSWNTRVFKHDQYLGEVYVAKVESE